MVIIVIFSCHMCIFSYGMSLTTSFLSISVSSVCGGSLTSFPKGNFTSPGYDGVSNYSRNLNCEWMLSNPNQGNSSIYIHFEDFYLETHQDCQSDVLEFRVGESSQGTRSFIHIYNFLLLPGVQ